MKKSLLIISVISLSVFIFSGCSTERKGAVQNKAEEDLTEKEIEKQNPPKYTEGVIDIKTKAESNINDAVKKEEQRIIENL